jgi:hypothetical protein
VGKETIGVGDKVLGVEKPEGIEGEGHRIVVKGISKPWG